MPCFFDMEGCTRGGSVPLEECYLTIFCHRHGPRSRRKRHWSGQLSLQEKKRLLAKSVEEEDRRAHEGGHSASRAKRPHDGASRLKALQVAAAEAASRDAHNRKCGLRSAALLRAADIDSLQGEVTLGDCWPSSDLTLRWLKQGRAKMEAFQQALRQHLSSPIRPCHWPFNDCPACRSRKEACGPEYPKLRIRVSPAAQSGSRVGEDGAETVSSSARQSVQREAYPSAFTARSECLSTRAGNCALIVSEDPLLRPSLLAMSLGIPEVHTVVMNGSSRESALMMAKCFGRTDSLKIFRSLEALEAEVFAHNISQELIGDAFPRHTCGQRRDSTSSSRQPVTASSVKIRCRLKSDKTDHQSSLLTARDLQSHLHRYRLVLIDDHYCGPIVSAFGLPQLLQFCRMHTCPVCCTVVPRRWQTLMTPSSCPPLLADSKHAGFIDGKRRLVLDTLQHSRIAASGRAMGCSFIRLEDVSLSERFCVFESFEMTPAKEFLDCVEVTTTSGSSPPVDSEQACHEGSRQQQEALEPLKGLKVSQCFQCARERQLSWVHGQRGAVSSGAVCGIEIPGTFAGFVMRNHILVDEGLSLPPSPPLMIFLSEEIPLTTGHMIMLGPDPSLPDQQHVYSWTGAAASQSGSWRTLTELKRNRRGSTDPSHQRRRNSRVNVEATVSASREGHRETSHKSACGADAGALVIAEAPPDLKTSLQGGPLAVPWKNLAQQKPTLRWQCVAICDNLRQSIFKIVLTLRDLQQATASHPAVDSQLSSESIDA
ncbi:hypothetical protein Efla_003078 [Eimeria flavescens]